MSLLQVALLACLAAIIVWSAWRAFTKEERFPTFVPSSAPANVPREFEAYAYRTSARFGSRVRINLADRQLAITGPQISPALYWSWIASQAALLAIAVGCFFASIILWRWQCLLAGALVFLASWAASGTGAVALWEYANVVAFAAGKPGITVQFPVEAVQRVSIGPGWARRGIWLVILPYYHPLDRISRGLTVSFEAPADLQGRQGVYALLMRSPEEAQALASALATG